VFDKISNPGKKKNLILKVYEVGIHDESRKGALYDPEEVKTLTLQSESF